MGVAAWRSRSSGARNLSPSAVRPADGDFILAGISRIEVNNQHVTAVTVRRDSRTRC